MYSWRARDGVSCTRETVTGMRETVSHAYEIKKTPNQCERISQWGGVGACQSDGQLTTRVRHSTKY